MFPGCGRSVPTEAPGPAPSPTVVLLPPTHPMLFGYYYADGRYGDHTAAVAPHTNAYVACAGCFDTATDWRPPLQAGLVRAAAARRPIIVLAGEPDDWERLIDLLAPVWEHVRMVEIAHEAAVRRATMDARVQNWRARIDRRGLPPKPVGAMESLCQTWQLWRCALWNGWTSPLLDWVGIEAYPPIPDVDPRPRLPFPIDYDVMHVSANLTAILTRAEARIPIEQQIYLAMMSYDRNGTWRDAATLVTVQRATYEWARTRPRVVALLPFAYSRPGGVLSHPSVKQELERIGGAIVTGPQ